MPDYKEMYLKIFRACEQAINILISAQRECEERYSSSTEPELTLVSLLTENKKGADAE